MELELKKMHLIEHEAVLETTIFREETLETIVPDAEADIMQLIETRGMVFLKEKAAMDGRAVLTGTVRLAVLYRPEGGTGPCRIEAGIPFNLTAEDTNIKNDCTILAVPRLISATTRTVNPRKVVIRAEIGVNIQIFAANQFAVPVEVEASGGTVEQMKGTCNMSLVTAIQEKRIAFEDDLSIPAGRPAAEKLMGSRVELQCRETKLIGNKLIFKGDAQVRLLYKSDVGGIEAADFVLPFSQITEVLGVGEESSCRVEMALTGAEFVLSGDGRTVSVSLNMLAQAVVREERSVDLLQDVYSTCAQVKAESKNFTHCLYQGSGTGRQTVREVIGTGAQIKSVVDAYCAIGRTVRQREGEQLRLGAQVTANVLCLTGDDEYSEVFRSMEISCIVDVPEEWDCQCSCVCSGMTAVPVADGVEVRFQLEFPYIAVQTVLMPVVDDVAAATAWAEDAAGRPSVVLCAIEDGERLWDIGKRYATAVEDIVRINGLDNEQIGAGMLLLIPKRR